MFARCFSSDRSREVFSWEEVWLGIESQLLMHKIDNKNPSVVFIMIKGSVRRPKVLTNFGPALSFGNPGP